MQVSTGVADVSSARLYYEVAGEGHPLVLTHVGIADRRMWDDQFEVFARQYKVIRWDVRGYGKSTMPRVPYSGLGGYQSPPDPIRDEIEAAIKQGDVARAVELELRRWVDGPSRTPDQVKPRAREKVREMDTDAFANSSEEGQYQPLDPPAIGRLGEIRVPTLVIVGDQDVPYIVDIAERLAAGIAAAKKTVISGAAHMVNMERPDEFNRIVLEFLAGVHPR